VRDLKQLVLLIERSLVGVRPPRPGLDMEEDKHHKQQPGAWMLVFVGVYSCFHNYHMHYMLPVEHIQGSTVVLGMVPLVARLEAASHNLLPIGFVHLDMHPLLRGRM